MTRDAWSRRATELLIADRATDPATPLRQCTLPSGAPLYVKDESVRPTGSVKHGFARSLFLDGVSRGVIRADTPLVDATSGNMAVAEAYFARLLGLPFTAVVPGKTSAVKRARIEEQGGACCPVDPPLAVYERAERLAADMDGHYLDCLTAIGPAVDACPPSLADEILADIKPDWVVTGVGTGATSRSLGRQLSTHIAVADPENSAYFPGWTTDCAEYATGMPSRIEGIGRPRMEPAFDPDVVDLVIPVPDATSVAAMRWLSGVGFAFGPSTGAAFWGALHLVHRGGPVVVIAADAAAPYETSYYDDSWVAAKGWDLTAALADLGNRLR
ncbi:pyridoxal-phosphate dependent enzyme [Actinocrispum sp. NPDC049592]|uniref:PLP-dependent cysteine synthase family protein n=1 Tax=Actinocrispum sp. NPDC049592 TaxID=3154835 RepID=UPI0034227B97